MERMRKILVTMSYWRIFLGGVRQIRRCKCSVCSVIKTNSMVADKQSRAKNKTEKEMNWQIEEKGRFTHYPVPSEVKMGKKLEFTS
jgi:hypothetical protein